MERKRQPHPGQILKERFLDPLGIRPTDLASRLGVSAARIDAIVRGSRGISTDTAIRLGLFFGVPAAWWLDMQARYDTEGAPLVDRLRERVAPCEGLQNVLVGPMGVRLLPASEKPEPGPVLITFSEEFEQRLRAQAALTKPRPPRKVRTVTYENGAVALIGSED